MSRGQHAADDGSFGRSASGAMVRGVALIVVAVVLGVLLLQATDGPDPFPAGAGAPGGDETTTSTTAPGAGNLTTTTSTPPTSIDPSTITVLVANGASIAGLAGDLTELVAAEEFEVVTPTDADEDVEESTVYFTPGFEEAANAVATVFDPVPEVAPLPDPQPVTDLAGANVVVVAGPDLVP